MRTTRILPVGVALVGLGVAPADAQSAEPTSIEEAILLAEERFGPTVDVAALRTSALAGIVAGLDEQLGLSESRVLSAEEYANTKRWLKGERRGVGVEFNIIGGHGLLVTHVWPTGSAHRGGLERGDLVVAANDHPFTGQPAAVIHGVLAQLQEADVIVDVKGAETHVRRVRLPRTTYNVSSVIEGTGPVPSYRIPFFGADTSVALRGLLEKLPPETPAVVLDIRDNPGGQLDEAIKAAGCFLREGSIAAQAGPVGGTTVAKPTKQPPAFSGQVVVLINENTKGVAEAFAQAMRSHQRGPLVGTRSSGVVSLPGFHPLEKDVVLQLPGTILTGPAGQSWHRTGLTPDIVVEPVASNLPPANITEILDLQRDTAHRIAQESP